MNTQSIENFVFKGKRDALVGLSHLFLDKQTISSNTFLDFLDKNATRLEKKSKYSLGHMIHLTGMNAERKKMKFDYDKGLDLLLKYNKTGEYIFGAGDPRSGIIEGWSKFNYDKAMKKLKQIGGKWYNKALKIWPKGIEQSIAKTKELKKTSKKFPMKKLKLESIKFNSARQIFLDGCDKKTYNFDALIKKDKTGEWIAWAGKFWNKFDYEKGLDAIIEKDKTGNWIILAGKYWKNPDYEKALKALKQKSKHFYNKALKIWPKGIEQSKEKIKQIEKKSKKLPMKKLKLGENKMNFKKEVRYYLNEKKDADRVRGGYKAMATRLSNDLSRKISPAQVKKYLSSLEKTKVAKGIDKRAKGAVSSDAYKWSSKYKIMLGHFAKK